MTKIKRMRNNPNVRIAIVNGRVVSVIVKDAANGVYKVEALYEQEEKEFKTYAEARDAAVEVKAFA